ncbi:MAG: prolipoprotein diacylglyceryl transferase [Candidatus Schekmanbacteria bacterium]|nr:prolipoprotein diacylglyceryl transferase [Candidatus Schekmanbacteria bacterium]
MYPTLFEIFGFGVKTYGTMIAIGIGFALLYISRQTKREGLDVEKSLDITLYLVLSGVIGARLLYVLLNFGYYKNNPSAIFKIWEGGLVFYGGFLAALAVGYFMLTKNKMPVWKFLDIFATALPLGHAFGRIGCFFAGCCYGKPTDVPWAITFTNPESLAYPVLGEHIHPTQLYESASNLMIFVILNLTLKRKKFDGQNALLYIALYGTARFIIEFFRGDERGFIFDSVISTSQGVALIIVPIVLFILIFKLKVASIIETVPKNKTTNKNQKKK